MKNSLLILGMCLLINLNAYSQLQAVFGSNLAGDMVGRYRWTASDSPFSLKLGDTLRLKPAPKKANFIMHSDSRRQRNRKHYDAWDTGKLVLKGTYKQSNQPVQTYRFFYANTEQFLVLRQGLNLTWFKFVPNGKRGCNCVALVVDKFEVLD